jgi:molybdenum cofactor cytidylyltransferase
MNGDGERRIAAVILAAGLSKRFGKDKLLSKIGEMTVIERSISSIPVEYFWKVAAVVPDDPSMNPYLPHYIVRIVNGRREEGIGTSISLATKFFMKEADGILFYLADQPFVGREIIAMLVTLFIQTQGKIVSCSVDGNARNPMIFPRKMFGELESLKGDEGAKRLAEMNNTDLIKVEVDPSRLVDIDTEEDIRRISKEMQDGK